MDIEQLKLIVDVLKDASTSIILVIGINLLVKIFGYSLIAYVIIRIAVIIKEVTMAGNDAYNFKQQLKGKLADTKKYPDRIYYIDNNELLTVFKLGLKEYESNPNIKL